MTGLFVGIHTMLAMQTKTPELQMSPEEGQQFMLAAQNVMRHYSVEATQQTLDWIALFSCAATIYGTRAAAVAARRSREKNPPKQSAQIHAFPAGVAVPVNGFDAGQDGV